MASTNEDANLDFSPRVTKERIYSDLDLAFGARTTSDGDIFKKTDAASVKQSIKSLVLTNEYEKPYRPEYGANVQGLLFELIDEEAGEKILDRVKRAIKRYEPRAAILSIDVEATPDYNKVFVIIEFRVINTGIVDVLKVTLGAADICDPPFSPAPPLIESTPDQILTEAFNGFETEAGINLLFDDEQNIYP